MPALIVPSGATAAYCHNVWIESMDDWPGDEVKAKMQYDKIMLAFERHQQRVAEKELRMSSAASQQNIPRKRARRSADEHRNEPDSDASVNSDENNSQPGATTSDSESELEEADEEPIVARRSKAIAQSHGRKQQQQLRWSKPGALSQRVGVSQSVLRSWADTGVVQSMVSAGGHRLFNVKSVKRHIAKAAKSHSSASQSELPVDQREMLVYVRLSDANRSEAQLQAAAEQIKAQVINKYKNQHTEDDQQICNIIGELETDVN